MFPARGTSGGGTGETERASTKTRHLDMRSGTIRHANTWSICNTNADHRCRLFVCVSVCVRLHVSSFAFLMFDSFDVQSPRGQQSFSTCSLSETNGTSVIRDGSNFYAVTRSPVLTLPLRTKPASQFFILHAAANPSRCCLRCQSNLRGRCSAEQGAKK